MAPSSAKQRRGKAKPIVQGRSLRPVIVAAVVGAICAYYFAILVPCRLLPQNHYYNLMADAFESGSLSLLVKPSKELLALKDPYDPAQNGPYRLHDASLYKGNYYLYYGPVPALVLFAPLDILLHVRLEQSTAVAFFLCLGFISSTLLLWFLLNKIRPPVPFWMFVTGVAALGFCNAGPFLLMRPDVYEVAISCGYFFAVTGLYLVISGIYVPAVSLGRLAGGSLCAGISVGSRPTYIIFALLLPLAVIGLLSQHRLKWTSREALRATICILAPFGICVLGILAYNYARFGNPLEFGTSYILAAINPKAYPMLRPDLFIPRLAGYLVYGYKLEGQFPFLRVARGTIFGEPEIGSLLVNPILCVGIIWLLATRIRSASSRMKYPLFLLILIFGAGVLAVLLLSVIGHPLIRYHVDYETLLLLPAIFAWCDLTRHYAAWPNLRRTIGIGGLALIAYGCWAGFASGWNDISPTAIRRFYDGNNLAARGDAAQAVEEYREATRISPDFALAENALAQVLAAQGRGMEAASHFSTAMHQFIGTNVAYRDKGYMPAFQGLCIVDPFGEYIRLAQILLQHRQTDEALLALDGMVNAFCDAGFCDQAINGAEAIAKVAASSNQNEFASRIQDRVRQYRAASLPLK